MSVDLVSGIVDAQLSAHAEVDEQAEFGGSRLGGRAGPEVLPQCQPHELAATFGSDDPATGDSGDEPVDGGSIDATLGCRSQDSGVDHLGAGDGGAGSPFMDAHTDALDLGKLRHQECLSACSPGRWCGWP